MLTKLNTPLKTTLALPCVADRAYVVETIDELPQLLAQLGNDSFHVLGGGSNILCSTTRVQTMLQIGIKGIQLLQTTQQAYLVQVGAGENWHDTVLYTLAQGWAGLENLALIPGWVGAAPVQNIGAYGVELCDRVHSVKAWDTVEKKAVSLSAEQCQFAYRDSVFKQNKGRYLITHVTFSLPRPWTPVLRYGELTGQFSHTPSAIEICNAVIQIRQRKLPDPNVIANAGSFFKNPLVTAEKAQALKNLYAALPCYDQPDGQVKLAVGWLIEHAGWKGYTRTVANGQGQVGVHSAQALVLVHLGGAQGADLLQLASDIQADVLAKFGVVLEREVNVW